MNCAKASDGGMARIAGAILAGGQARRFHGQPKGLVKLPNGMTIIEKLLREMGNAGIADCVICAGKRQDYTGLNAELITDNYQGKGPLAGIEAALSRYQDIAQAVLVLPCDMPLLTAAELLELLAGFNASGCRLAVAATGSFKWHSLCTVIHVELLSDVRRALQQNRLSVTKLWRELRAAAIDFSKVSRFTNLNSPAQLAEMFLPADVSNVAKEVHHHVE
jgi:molybdopterin-guanine dinucleotide biosynthesis protein A